MHHHCKFPIRHYILTTSLKRKPRPGTKVTLQCCFSHQLTMSAEHAGPCTNIMMQCRCAQTHICTANWFYVTRKLRIVRYMIKVSKTQFCSSMSLSNVGEKHTAAVETYPTLYTRTTTPLELCRHTDCTVTKMEMCS